MDKHDICVKFKEDVELIGALHDGAIDGLVSFTIWKPFEIYMFRLDIHLPCHRGFAGLILRFAAIQRQYESLGSISGHRSVWQCVIF